MNVEHVSNINYDSNSGFSLKPTANCESTVVGETTSPGLFKSFLNESMDNLYNLYVHPELSNANTDIAILEATASVVIQNAICISASIITDSSTMKKKVGRKPLSEEVKAKRAQEKEDLRLSKLQAKANN